MKLKLIIIIILTLLTFTYSLSHAIESKTKDIHMNLSKQQMYFTKMVGLLINYATSMDYGLTFGDAYASSGHCKDSFHYKRLAIDFNLFLKGEYTEKTEDYLPLGLFWENIGGTWGGRWQDGNHFSYGE